MKVISLIAALKYSAGSEPHYKASTECWGQDRSLVNTYSSHMHTQPT